MAATSSNGSPGWEAVTQQKRNDLLDCIPPHWRLDERELDSAKTQTDARIAVPAFLSPLERTITSLSAHVLLKAIQAGDYTAREVVGAFSHRAVLAHQLTNCLSELDLASAMVRAQELDILLREQSRPVGPLHGLPVSLMDRFNVEGLDSACGFTSWIGRPKTAADEGILLRSLRRAGAIIYCKTSVPMGALVRTLSSCPHVSFLMLTMSHTGRQIGETINNIHGFTVNPCNTALSAGGAGGGESCLEMHLLETL